MAAITTSTQPHNQRLVLVRNASAQANTGQTDWINVPDWARSMIVYLNWTAKAGTSPLIDFKLQEADPVARNDSYVLDFLDWNGITQLSAEALAVIAIGPGITGIADDDTGSYYKLNGLLPPLLGLKTTLDRTTGDETYTYTLSVVFFGK